MHWLILEAVKLVARLTPLIVSQLVEATIGKSDVLISSRAITSICNVLWMVSSIDGSRIYHLLSVFSIFALKIYSSSWRIISVLIIKADLTEYWLLTEGKFINFRLCAIADLFISIKSPFALSLIHI